VRRSHQNVEGYSPENGESCWVRSFDDHEEALPRQASSNDLRSNALSAEITALRKEEGEEELTQDITLKDIWLLMERSDTQS